IAFQALWPGEFGFGLEHGGSQYATWIAVWGAALALVLAVVTTFVVRRVDLTYERHDWLSAVAAGLFLLPVVVHGFAHRRPAATTRSGSSSHDSGRIRRSRSGRYTRTRALPSTDSEPLKVLLVTLYFPPAGGGGVQRPLKFATHLPALGIETHVLAPDNLQWIHSDPALAPPTQAWIHRARYLGPRARRLAEGLHGGRGLDRLSRAARA